MCAFMFIVVHFASACMFIEQCVCICEYFTHMEEPCVTTTSGSYTAATRLCFSVGLLQTAARGPWPHVTDPENVEKATCGSAGIDGYRRAWSVDKESDSCYWAAWWRAVKGVGKGGCWRRSTSPLYLLWPQVRGRPGEGTCQTPQAGRAALPSLSPLCPPLCLQLDICLFGARAPSAACNSSSLFSYMWVKTVGLSLNKVWK